MGRKNANLNPGAAVGLIGCLVFLIGLIGTLGSFLFAAAERRGRYTVFYGAIVWGLLQIIYGFVLAIRWHRQRQTIQEDDGDEDGDEESEGHDTRPSFRSRHPDRQAKYRKANHDDADYDEADHDRPSRRRRSGRQPAPLPTPLIIGCGVAGGLLLLGVVFAVVMIVVQSRPDPDDGRNPPPPQEPPRLEIPVAEDLGPKQGQTPIAGATGDPTFKESAPDGGLLVGFDVGLGEAFGVELVRAIQPRFQTPRGEVLGRKFGTHFTRTVSVKARPGYAVGALNVKAGLVVNGFSVTFMRVKGNTLDPKDSYSSDWIGDQTGGSGPTLLGGDGNLIIGIIGRRTASECNGLGLLRKL